VIEVVKAPPFATIQDLGWRSGRAIGLPEGGAMDRGLLSGANTAVGNVPGAAAIEWALGPGALRVDTATVLCVLADATIRRNGAEYPAGVVRLEAGETIEVVPRGGGDRFVYVAVRGGIDVPEVLGSRSTYLPGGFGGFEGRRLKSGDRLPVGAAPAHSAPPPRQRLPQPSQADVVTLRVTRGPQWDRFDEEARTAFLAARYTVSGASDRMGYRLEGTPVAPRETATLPSEAACPGAVQIPDDGQPIVLMPDGPTVGGSPKIAVVLRDDVARLAQCQPGRAVRFHETPA
jgi:antagonist of KipI